MLGLEVTLSDNTLAWAELAVTFTSVALKAAVSYDDPEKYAINVSGLKEFFLEGVVAGVSDSKALARITGRANNSVKTDGALLTPLDEDQERSYKQVVREG